MWTEASADQIRAGHRRRAPLRGGRARTRFEALRRRASFFEATKARVAAMKRFGRAPREVCFTGSAGSRGSIASLGNFRCRARTPKPRAKSGKLSCLRRQ